MSTRNYLLIAALVSTGFVLSACNAMIGYSHTANPPVAERQITPPPPPPPGPPPHAPAHGYRCKNSEGVQLMFDSGMGLYLVVGYRDYYFNEGRYYRWHGSAWQVSRHINRGWGPASDKAVPPGLRKTHSHGHKKGK